MSQYFSFQACERVRHLGCLSAQAVASRYDKSFFSFYLCLVNLVLKHMSCFRSLSLSSRIRQRGHERLTHTGNIWFRQRVHLKQPSFVTPLLF